MLLLRSSCNFQNIWRKAMRPRPQSQSRLKSTARERNDQTEPGFTAQYIKAMSMAELYAVERPPAIPLEEHERRRRIRYAAEIVEAAVRIGKSEAFIRERLAEIDAVFPDLINLHKMKASDWVLVVSDVDAVAQKLVTIKSVFPKANAFKIVASLPKLLLKPAEMLRLEAEKSRKQLSSLSNPDAVVEAVPELVDPVTLARAISSLRAAMPTQDPLQILDANPEVLLSLGSEADIKDSAEYGELSTKD
ncbi:hypothetical protein CEUSTIGMA_g940.t1 [Chlamydomonas eustigma]|uniref:Uncharacterized protein n=1 Tax=Chlamydomonas eustigma TaxID=1157962 RepID=A0A250WRN3_9CHLO|nr:hypothetical protein CEUSTIGMA_g940.t1 [Chlamydomonas eustigma]|eukprot:GAX73488.1 hypothetical protein CEUSTIGMA_g940.t1 [Chlamydomonas eustigma]